MRVHLTFACAEDWQGMDGDERERRCAACVCKVYNLTTLGLARAQELMAHHASGQEVCVRFDQNADGTVKFARATMAAIAVGGLALGGPAFADGSVPTLGDTTAHEASLGDAADPLADVQDTDCVEGLQGGHTAVVTVGLTPDEPPPVKPRPLMGKPAPPNWNPPPPTPTPAPAPTTPESD